MTLSMRSEAAGLCRASWPDRDALKDHGSALVYGSLKPRPYSVSVCMCILARLNLKGPVERFKCGNMY